MTKRSESTSAIVTGAGSGIGRAFALELAARGGRVVCADIDLASATDTVAKIGGTDRALAVQCDVGVEQAVVGLADTSEKWFAGPFDLVINNAGIGAGGKAIGNSSLDEWRKVVEVNLWGVIYGCHTFVPRLRAWGRGGVINVASAASFAAAPGMAAYNVTKAGVLALSETLAAELTGTRIRVTVLCPTFVPTNIANTERITDASRRMAAKMMKRSAFSPERVAKLTLDAHAAGTLHVVPQLDARLLWRLKRLTPAGYTRAVGFLARLGRATALEVD